MENPVAFIIGILLIIAIIIWRLSDLLFFSFRAKSATGKITNWLSSMEKGKEVFHPVIEYHTESGETVRYRADESCEDRPMYPVGTEVTVRYDPKKPKMVRTTYPKV